MFRMRSTSPRAIRAHDSAPWKFGRSWSYTACRPLNEPRSIATSFTGNSHMVTTLWILAAVAAVVVVLAVVIALQPAAFRLSRSGTITAPPSAVFDEVNDLRRWEAWSPWAKIDPACKMTYEGAPSGVGAIVSWSGNNKVGEGRMTIIDSRPEE